MRVKEHARYSRCGFAARVSDPRTGSETRILLYATQVRREYAGAAVRGEREKGRRGTLKRRGARDAHGHAWGTGTGGSTRNQCEKS
jgi:hypothetical protein